MWRKSVLMSVAMMSVGACALASPITIPDFSFESPSTPTGTSLNVSNSTFGGVWSANLDVAVDNPVNDGVGSSGETWATPVPDGSQVLHLLAAGDPYGVQVDQVVPVTYAAGQTYTMSVYVGSPWGNVDPMHYAIRIFGANLGGAHNQYLELATDQTNPVANGQWVDVVDTFTVPANSPLIGSGQIEFNLTNGLGYDSQPGSGDVYFDDISVDVANPVVPEPTTMMLSALVGSAGLLRRWRRR